MAGHNFMTPNWAKLAQHGVYPENKAIKAEVEKIEEAQDKIAEIQEKEIEEEKDELLYCPLCADNHIKIGFKSEGGLRLHLLGKHKLFKKKAAIIIEGVKKAS